MSYVQNESKNLLSWYFLCSCSQTVIYIFIHSFHWHVQNATIPCRSQELLPFLSVTYFFLPPFSTNYSSILSHPILPSISWSTSQSFCSQIYIKYPLGSSISFHSLYMSKPTHTILFPSILCTCPNQHNLFNLTASITVGFLTLP